MFESIPALGGPLNGAAEAGRQAAHMAMQQVSAVAGASRARQNAKEAVIDIAVAPVDGAIFDCSYKWHPRAIDHQPLEERPLAIGQQAVEQASLARLLAIKDRLLRMRAVETPTGLLETAQQARELVGRTSAVHIPIARQGD